MDWLLGPIRKRSEADTVLINRIDAMIDYTKTITSENKQIEFLTTYVDNIMREQDALLGVTVVSDAELLRIQQELCVDLHK
jgi:hypothetical protein